MKLPLLALALCLSALPAQAQTQTTTTHRLSYQQAVKKAAADQSIAVIVLHGSDWNPLGEKLLAEIGPKLNSHPGIVLGDVDSLQNVTEQENTSNKERNEGWPGGRVSIPAVFAFGPDGQRYAVRTRLELYDSETTPEAVIDSLLKNCQKRLEHEQKMAAAVKNNELQTELRLLSEIIALPLDRPEIDLKRIEEIDPQDEWGIVTIINFPNLYSMINTSRSDAAAGKTDEAVTRYTKMLEAKSLHADQRAQVLLALGTLYQHTDRHADAARKAFQDAVAAAPESVSGKIAAQRLE